jgi:electron transport complex protein RnfD
VVTGVLLAFVLPPTVGWYVPVVGALVAIGAGKQAFGGLGANFFNPALLARAFLQFAFPTEVSMPTWPILGVPAGFGRVLCDVASPDAVTTATPLALLGGNPGVAWRAVPEATPFGPPLLWHLPTVAAWVVLGILVVGALAGIYFAVTRESRLVAVLGIGALLLFGVVPTGDISFGLVPGCIGETSAWALLLGGLALIYYRLVNWRLPVAYIATVAVLVALLPTRAADGSWAGLLVGQLQPERVLVHVFAGGLFIGAFFMITDMVTSPLTSKGQVIFGILAGLMVALIRLYGGYPEGVCYSILLANAARPIIDRYTMPRVFGLRAAEKKPAKAAG